MTDPYQRNPNPYGQPSPYGPNPYGGQPNPYGQGRPGGPGVPGQGQPNPYGPGPYGGQQPNPYGQGRPGGPGVPGQGQPNPYRGQGRPDPYGPSPHGSQPDPYATRQYEPGQFDQFGAPGDPYGDPYGGQFQGSYGQPSGWGAGGGFPPAPPPKSRVPLVLLSVLAVLVLAGGVVAAVVLLGGEDSPPAAQTTSSRPTTTAPDPTTDESTSEEPTTSTGAAGDKTFTAGQCATLTPEENNRATLNETVCGGTESDVLVAKVQQSECVKDYITFTADVGKIYCLALDAKEGDCFQLEQLAKKAQACAGGQVQQVAKVYEVADKNQCNNVPNTERIYVYPEPARTLCFTKTS